MGNEYVVLSLVLSDVLPCVEIECSVDVFFFVVSTKVDAVLLSDVFAWVDSKSVVW